MSRFWYSFGVTDELLLSELFKLVAKVGCSEEEARSYLFSLSTSAIFCQF